MPTVARIGHRKPMIDEFSAQRSKGWFRDPSTV
jgi:hypothetical protein